MDAHMIMEQAEQHIPPGYPPDLYKLRHSAAHIMAQAVLELFPTARLAIGPPVEDRFYYDFELPRPLRPDDLAEIEALMRRIIAEDHPFTCRAVDADEARALFAGQPYTLELIAGLEQGGLDENGERREGAAPALSVYTQAGFTDLCRGPHAARTGALDPAAVKLLSVAGAYWRGDESRPMLQRIYGTAWRNREELDAYLWRMEEAARRDHRRLGRELDLFSSNDEVGAGLILWHPKGGLVRSLIEEHWSRLHEQGGYDFVYTPHIGKAQLWQTCGHLDFYRESMYAPLEIEGQEYYLKPMNCPFHMHIYNSRVRSYRELPLRFCERGAVYRYERSGTLHGLLRVRGFTQDDAHHFCRPDQVMDEVRFALEFSLRMLRSFGFTEFGAYLSTRPEKAVGEPEQWAAAEAALEQALDAAGVAYEVDAGGGAFYGPKIDLKVEDALGRGWQLSTIQFDFNLPERFDLSYVGEDGRRHRPTMVHRALLGSLERFFGVLIEHYGGAFPVWLAPVQAVVIPIADAQAEYAGALHAALRGAGVRSEVDDSGERMANKVRRAQEQKVPYMLIVGKREAQAGTVSLRLRTGEELPGLAAGEVIARIREAAERKEGL